MKRVTISAALLATACLAAGPTIAAAAQPTQSDFDACNQMAQSKLATPSASPHTQQPSDGKSGSSTGEPQAAPSQETASQAQVANQANQLQGIEEASKNDPAYQQAYRQCMNDRGFRD
jgi:hypothetical protein